MNALLLDELSAAAHLSEPWLGAIVIGTLVGLRHAVEPDHLMAVATLVTRERNVLACARLGASWGLGHAAALLVVGAAFVLARQALPLWLQHAFELGVAVMLIAMGARAIREASRLASRGPAGLHRHGEQLHMHPAAATHVHLGRWSLARQPLVVGLIHGLAGSGTLTALAVAAMPTAANQMGYMLAFGVGSATAMAAAAALAGWPAAALVRSRSTGATLFAVTGVAAIGFGLGWGAPVVRQLLQQ